MSSIRFWKKFWTKPTGLYNCNNKNSLKFDNFIQQSSGIQILQLVGVVVILFAIAGGIWFIVDRVQNYTSKECIHEEEGKIAQSMAADISATTTINDGKELDTTPIDSQLDKNLEENPVNVYQTTIASPSETTQPSQSTPKPETTQTQEVSSDNDSAVNATATQEAEYTPLWYEVPYDIFIQSINPSLSKDVRSFWKEVLIFLLFLITSFGLSGLIFTILINMFERRKEKWENGDINYDITKDFVLIIGGHKMVNQLCKDLLSPKALKLKENTVLVIQTRRKAIMVRKELEAKIGKELTKRVFIYNGDRTSEENLMILNPQCAQQIYIIGEESHFDGNSHDAFSLQCLKLIDKIIEQDMRKKGLLANNNANSLNNKVMATKEEEDENEPENYIIPCHVMFEYQSSTKIFQYTDRSLCPRLDFIPFNYYEKWAAQALVFNSDVKPIPSLEEKASHETKTPSETPSNCTNSQSHETAETEETEETAETAETEEVPENQSSHEAKEEKKAEDKYGIPSEPKIKYPFILGNKPEIFQDQNKRVHIIIIGMSKMGTMFAAMAAHVCHFPNFFNCKEHPRTLITFIDKEGKVEMNYFKGRNPSLCELSRWRYVDAEKCMNEDQVVDKVIYQKEFSGVDPMKQLKAKSIFLGNNIDPGLMDIDWEFIKGDLGTPSVQKYLQDAANDDGCVTTIAVCIPVAYEAVSSSLFMPEEVYQSDNVTQILVLQHASDAVVLTASQEIETEFVYRDDQEIHLSVNPYKKLRPFGMFDQCSYVNHLDILPMIINYIYIFGDDRDDLKDILNKEIWQKEFDKLGEDLCRDLAQTLKTNKPVGIIKKAANKFVHLTTLNGKSVQAMRASNFYNSYSILYKAQVFQIAPSSKPLDRNIKEQEDKIFKIAHIEHNRWDTEQLFVGYRPVKATDKPLYSAKVTDQNSEANAKQTSTDKAEVKWGTRTKEGNWKEINLAKDLKLRRIHPDIHSYDKTDIDPGLDDWTKFYDIKIALMTPVLYKCYLMILGNDE